MSEAYTPPFRMTDEIISLVIEIGELVGRLSVDPTLSLTPRLRKETRIRSIYSSLAIEQNTLSLDQVTDVIEGRRVLGPPDDILEVQNALEANRRMDALKSCAMDDLLTAHRIMMQGLIAEAGAFRTGSVGVYSGGRLIHRGAAAAAVVLDSKARAATKGVGNAQFMATFKDGALYYSAGFKLKVPFFKLATEGIYLKKTLIIELYGGYSEDDDARYVYVTKYGTVYHESLSCRHLNITILSVSMDGLDTRRNKSGGKYKPCEYCIRGKGSGVVYITPEGDRYHSNRDCRGLLRNIRKVKLADVIETHAPCADCGHLADN